MKISTHGTQANAIARGKSEAKRDCVDLVTHGRDGRIQSKDSYGNETSRKDTEHSRNQTSRAPASPLACDNVIS